MSKFHTKPGIIMCLQSQMTYILLTLFFYIIELSMVLQSQIDRKAPDFVLTL